MGLSGVPGLTCALEPGSKKVCPRWTTRPSASKICCPETDQPIPLPSTSAVFFVWIARRRPSTSTTVSTVPVSGCLFRVLAYGPFAPRT